MAMIMPQRLLALTGAVLLAACSAPRLDVRLAQSGLDARPLPAFDQAYSAGKTYFRSNRVGLALVLFEKALAINPKSVAALNAVGAAYDELHFPNMAMRFYAKALALEPDSADTLNNMAVSALIAGKPEAARELFRRALTADAAIPTIRANFGLLDEPQRSQTARVEVEVTVPPSVPTIVQIGAASFELSIPNSPPARRRDVQAEVLPSPQPVAASVDRREQLIRGRMEAFLAEKEARCERAAAVMEEERQVAAAHPAIEAPLPTARERYWIARFRAFFAQNDAQQTLQNAQQYVPPDQSGRKS